ncbi:MAG: sulfur relay protein DsrC [Pseudomonadota bacterium]
MIWLSEILLENHEISSFEELKKAVIRKAEDGEVFLGMDVKPPYGDTPDDWEDLLEGIFTSKR